MNKIFLFFYMKYRKLIFKIDNFLSLNSKYNNIKIFANWHYKSYSCLMRNNNVLDKWKKNNFLNYHFIFFFLNSFINFNSFLFVVLFYLKKNFSSFLSYFKKKIKILFLFIIFYFKKSLKFNIKKIKRIKKKLKKKKWIYF